MNPVDELAAIRALIIGATANVPALNAKVLAHKNAMRPKGGFESDWGDITFNEHPPKIKFYEDQLIEWARVQMPHEVEKERTEVIPEHTVTVPAKVRPSLYKTLEDRLEIEDGEVIDTKTGEICEFAYIEPGEPDTVVFRPSKEQKARAEALVADRLEALAAAVNREVTS